MDQINLSVQTQVIIVAAVALASIIISFILLVLTGLLMVKVKRLSRLLSKLEQDTNRGFGGITVDHQFQSPQIHPHEELGRRGFFKFPVVKTAR